MWFSSTKLYYILARKLIISNCVCLWWTGRSLPSYLSPIRGGRPRRVYNTPRFYNLQFMQFSLFCKVWEFALGFFVRIGRFLWAKEQVTCKKEQIAPRRSLKKTTERIAHFWERFARIKSESLMSLFFKEKQEQFAHSRSFVNSDTSELHTVAL